MSRPASYREQKACANCKHHVIEHVCGAPYHICEFGPQSGQQVEATGICDEWEGEEGDGDDKASG